MMIHVKRNSSEVGAYVIYNFHQVADCILLNFQKTEVDAGFSMLLMYDFKINKWKDIDGKYKTEPFFFEQVYIRLKKVFDEAETYLHNISESKKKEQV